MTLTHERAYLLTRIINADKERAKVLLSLDAEEATARIRDLGYEFEVEEIREYGKAIRAYIGGHMRDNELGNVVGGVTMDYSTLLLIVQMMHW